VSDDAAELDSVREREPDAGAHSWRWLLAAVLVVVVTVTPIASSMAHSARSSAGAFSTAFTDDFDRFDAPRLGFAPGGARWVEVAGRWSLVSKAAAATSGTPSDSIVIALAGSVRYGAIQARVTGMARCGLVVRYVSPDTYLALERVPQYGLWNLLSVVDGKETLLGTVGDVKDPTVLVRLEAGQRVVTAAVRDQSVSVIVPTRLSAAPVGLMGRGSGRLGCSWDDVRAENGR
jgi:hypothetical protein